MQSPFPIYINDNQHPKDGSLYNTHNYCKLSFNNNCKLHYSKIKDNEGFYQCPYGFASYVSKNNNETRIFTSLYIDKISVKKWLRKKIKKTDSQLSINTDKVTELIKSYDKQCAEQNYAKHLTRDIDRKTNIVENKKEVLDDTLHELRRINKQLKMQAFFLNKELESEDLDLTSIKDKAKNIQAATELVSVRLDAYDFTLNPDLVETGNKMGVNLYRKFEKAKKCLSLYAIDEEVQVVFEGNSHELIKAYEIIDIMPYILIENAIRYSPSQGIVNCKFNISDNALSSIEIKNIGPKLEEEELPKILEKGVRGKSVQDKIKGTGKGLHIVKLICDYNDIDFSVDSKPIDNEYGEFTATIKFK